ncbi:amidohydrolase [Nakamurella lactea]|uniref:amidohydrolase n=1 Tax=Nakamurella lactea TaxID=459515 RepID=UPI00040A8AF5|nr:amidohydrolase [Nakamurella lactea]
MSQRLFRHPRIHTGVPGAAPVTAVLTEGEQIVAVGDAGELAGAASGVVQTIDLDGAAVLPGLYDAHIHTAALARDAVAVDLRGTATLDEALTRIGAHAARLPEGAWVVGGSWDSNRWTPPRQPDRQALDRVCPDRPVLLATIDGHTSWANSMALQRAGIGADTPDPVGGQYARDAAGEPTGILREAAARPVQAMMAVEHNDDLPTLLLQAQEQLLSVGLTSVHDIDGEDCRDAYLQLYRDRALKIRVHKAIPVSFLDRAIEQSRRTGDGDDWFSTGPVKIFGDGALGSHTCHMARPFAGDPGNTGIAVTPYDEIVALARKAVTAGIAVATHAIGDRANELVLDAYAELAADRTLDLGGLRLRIEHTQYLRPGDAARMAELGVVASMQPTHCTTDYDLADELLAGHELLAYAWRTLLNAGAPLAFGSDAPVESPNPFLGLHAAITRQRADGSPPGGWQPEQRLTPVEALAAFTFGSAFAAGQDHRKGLLTPGRLADFVAVDTDPLAAPPEQIPSTTVLTTVVGGEIRWQSG